MRDNVDFNYLGRDSRTEKFYFQIEDQKTFFIDDTPECIEQVFTAITKCYLDGKYDEKLLDEYINACKQFISEYKPGIPSYKAKNYVNYLYMEYDDGFFTADSINYQIKLFNEYCLSLIKAEYLLIDNFSSDYLKGKATSRQALNDIFNQNYIQNSRDENEQYLDTAVLEEGETIQKVNTQLKTFFSSCIAHFQDETNTEKVKPLDLESFFISAPTCMAFCDDLSAIRKEYFLFNRKIDAYCDLNIKKQQVTNYFDSEEQYARRCQVTLFKYYHQEDGSSVNNNVCALFVYLFRKMLDMTLIDHNFISSVINLKKLLKLDELLNDDIDKSQETIINLLRTLPEKLNVDSNLISELLKTLDLFRIKNNILISKILQRAGNDINNYAYIGEQGVTIFNHDVRNKSFYISKFVPNFENCKDENVVLQQYEAYLNRKLNDEFNEYEKCFLNLIYNKTDYDICHNEYQRLERMIASIACNNQLGCNDVYLYNQVIKDNFINHFNKYGEYIKKLKIEIQSKHSSEYLNEILQFIELDNSKNVFSCSFIREHLKWSLNVLERSVIEGVEKKDVGFDYILLSEHLLKQYEALIKNIENDYYCLNYSSFFHDCFYCVKFAIDVRSDLNTKMDVKSVKRQKILTNGRFENITDQAVIFISSTWQPPVSIHVLKEEYLEMKNLKELRATQFYNAYFKDALLGKMNIQLDKNTSETQKNVAAKIAAMSEKIEDNLDDNKRSTVQTLGIFAAFLALATISLGSATNGGALTNIDLLKLMLVMTLCFTIFVALLHFIVCVKKSKTGQQFAFLVIFGIVFILFLSLLLL